MLCLLPYFLTLSKADFSPPDITFVRFLTGGKQLVIGRGKVNQTGPVRGSIEIWDIKQKRSVRVVAKDIDVSQASISPDNRYVATGGLDRQPAEVRELATGRLVKRFETGTNAYPEYNFLPDSKTLVLRASALLMEYGHLEVQICPLPNGESKTLISSEGASQLAIDPTGKWIAASTRISAVSNQLPQTWSFGLHIYDAKSGSLEQAPAIPQRIVAMAFSPDGRQLAIRKGTGTIEFLDTHTWQVRRKVMSPSVPEGFGGGFNSSNMTYSADGKRLFVGLEGLGVAVYDFAKGGQQRTFYAPTRVFWRSFDVAPDGKSFAVANTLCSVEIIQVNDLPGGGHPKPIAHL